ncbi:hypothetical protein CMI47_13300 [Candidatus Pacearchaeota archaeon]|nr:hypothetical protein [Candidatus Pacearchaeota archaeon]|tara:strand:+ start:280 stop:477 length:198 start_codon:yes stop_codon:yes gene_type:complete
MKLSKNDHIRFMNDDNTRLVGHVHIVKRSNDNNCAIMVCDMQDSKNTAQIVDTVVSCPHCKYTLD